MSTLDEESGLSATVGSHSKVEMGERPMTAQEIKKTQQVIKDIGSHKKKGILIVLEAEDYSENGQQVVKFSGKNMGYGIPRVSIVETLKNIAENMMPKTPITSPFFPKMKTDFETISHEELGEQSITPDDIKKYQKLIEEIGSRKKDGYIFIAEAIKRDKGMDLDSIGFVNKIPTYIVVKNLLSGFGDVEVFKENE